ncbi:MAG: class I SAM-dependent methyltransferase [Phycisphaeraceae bacterium]|nr:class I SAM-dependent methyltransferase [Phycisphaeraceae bacterium]
MQVDTNSFVLRDGPELDAIRRIYMEHFYGEIAADLAETQDGKHDIEANARGRYNRTITKVIPWIQRVFDLRGQRVLEIGSGTGSSGVALAQVSGEVLGVEPKGRCLEVARRRAEIMGRPNVRFVQDLSPKVFDRLRDEFPPPLDAVVLSAVLEHQTVPERIQTLRLSWDCLRPGGILVVAESPNRLTYMDGHTSRLMFFDMLEEELALRAFRLSPRKAFVSDMQACVDKSWQAAREMWVRRGRGICHYDFDVALPGRPYEILADGYEPEPLEAFGVTYEERLLQSCVAMNGLDVPSVFLRHTIYGIFRKPDPSRPTAPTLDRTFSPFIATRDDLELLAALLADDEHDKAKTLLDKLRGGDRRSC